jgi:8-oxo-dGTP pyrophosphatase MutT (NUDIX family)
MLTVIAQPVRRDTARVILAGPGGRVLLFRHLLREPWSREGWLPPGGTIEPGESAARAAARELAEETGHLLTATGIGAAVAVDSGRWQARGTVFASSNWYFFARAAAFQIDLSGQDEDERRELLDYRWWTAGELESTSDLVFPAGLAGLVPRLLTGELPDEPVRLPWR